MYPNNFVVIFNTGWFFNTQLRSYLSPVFQNKHMINPCSLKTGYCCGNGIALHYSVAWWHSRCKRSMLMDSYDGYGPVGILTTLTDLRMKRRVVTSRCVHVHFRNFKISIIFWTAFWQEGLWYNTPIHYKQTQWLNRIQVFCRRSVWIKKQTFAGEIRW